jgi:hypothetical protein
MEQVYQSWRHGVADLDVGPAPHTRPAPRLCPGSRRVSGTGRPLCRLADGAHRAGTTQWFTEAAPTNEPQEDAMTSIDIITDTIRSGVVYRFVCGRTPAGESVRAVFEDDRLMRI